MARIGRFFLFYFPVIQTEQDFIHFMHLSHVSIYVPKEYD